MKELLGKIVYGVYYRKSSDESSERQIQSIPDQIRDTDIVIQREKLLIGKKFPGESQSAYTPGRIIFADIIKDIMDGIINAILVWHPNRLARNPIDGGMIIHLMDIGKLKMIRTPSKTYYNTGSDKFTLNLEFSMSKKDSDDKSEAVKRALKGRAERGLPNGLAHIGYINDQSKKKGDRDWLQDPVRYPLVKKLLTMMLTGKYSVSELHKYAKDEMKLTTPIRKKEGGNPIAISYMYTILRDPIHAGFFFQKSDEEKIRYELKGFEPMISEEEYWQIQSLLGKKGISRTTKQKAVYSHFAKCGTCNGNLSPDFKNQTICTKCKYKFSSINMDTCPKCDTKIDKMDNPTHLNYVFYYCLNHKKHRTNCSGNGIEEKNLEQQLLINMDQLAISKELSAWCIDNIGKLKDEALDDVINVQRNLEQEIIATEKKLERLTMLHISKDRSKEEDTEFDNLKNKLIKEISLLKLKVSETDVEWLDEAKNDFDLMSEVVLIIKNGTAEQKKDILFAFGSNLTIEAKKLSVINKKSIEAFKKYLLLARAENKAFEPENTLANKDKTEVFASVYPTLLRW